MSSAPAGRPLLPECATVTTHLETNPTQPPWIAVRPRLMSVASNRGAPLDRAKDRREVLGLLGSLLVTWSGISAEPQCVVAQCVVAAQSRLRAGAVLGPSAVTELTPSAADSTTGQPAMPSRTTSRSGT